MKYLAIMTIIAALSAVPAKADYNPYSCQTCTTQGYNGNTGAVDTVYIPAGVDPNPAPNVYGR